MLSVQGLQSQSSVNTGKMPHAVDERDAQDEQDDLLIQKALDPQYDFDFSRDLEPGEKADDAIDFEDISDDDLAEEEDEGQPNSSATIKVESAGASFEDELGFTQEDDLPGLTTSGSAPEGDGLDDLFGDAASSPIDLRDGPEIKGKDDMGMSFEFEDDLFSESLGTAGIATTTEKRVELPTNESLFRPIDFSSKTAAPSREQLLQQELFAMSRNGFGSSDFPPAPPENQEELLTSLWPKFERDTVPRFMDLLPPKKARYIGKTPLKVPKPVQPTKVSLELAPDQEKSFKLTTSVTKRNQEEINRQGIVEITETNALQSSSEDEIDLDSDYEGEPVGGVTWQDFQVVCEDWDIHSLDLSPSPEIHVPGSPLVDDQDDLFRDLDEEWDRQLGSAKVRCPPV